MLQPKVVRLGKILSLVAIGCIVVVVLGIGILKWPTDDRVSVQEKVENETATADLDIYCYKISLEVEYLTSQGFANGEGLLFTSTDSFQKFLREHSENESLMLTKKLALWLSEQKCLDIVRGKRSAEELILGIE